MLKLPPLVLDNTVVSRFGRVGRFDILSELYSGNILLPTEVIKEAVTVPTLDNMVNDALTTGWMEEQSITFQDDPDLLRLFAKLSNNDELMLTWFLNLLSSVLLGTAGIIWGREAISGIFYFDTSEALARITCVVVAILCFVYASVFIEYVFTDLLGIVIATIIVGFFLFKK